MGHRGAELFMALLTERMFRLAAEVEVAGVVASTTA
jgi:hypothetical protein